VKKYECVFILRADQPEAAMQARVDRCKEIIAAHSGEVTLENHWGVRRLAYEIEFESRGNYMFLKFNSNGTVVADLDKFLRQDDQILRHLVVVDEDWAERNRASMAKRRAIRPAEATPAPAPIVEATE
jgi:small subunit ribosomal protein S6